MSCWDGWFRHWDTVVEVGKALSLSEEEVRASIEELMKVFNCEWVEDNRNRHHFSYYIEHPEYPGHVLELLLLGYSLHVLGGVESVSSERIARLKDPLQWVSAYYELGILAQLKRELKQRGLYLVLPESEQRLRSIVKLGGPDAIVLDGKDRYIHRVEVKYLQPIPDVLMKLDEYSRKLAEKFNIYQSEGRTVIIRIVEEVLPELMQSIGEDVDPFKLKGIIKSKFISLLDSIIDVIEGSESGRFYSVEVREGMERVEEGDTVKYTYSADPGRIEVRVPKDKDSGSPIRGRVAFSIPTLLVLLLTYFVNMVRAYHKLEEALKQRERLLQRVPDVLREELRLPLVVVLGPAIPLELRMLGVPFVSELEVCKALRILREELSSADVIREVWLHIPEDWLRISLCNLSSLDQEKNVKKYVHVPIIGIFKTIS